MTTTNDRIAERRAELSKQRAARKDPDDLTLSPNERRAYEDETRKIDATIATFNAAVEAWAALPSSEPLTRGHAHLTRWRDQLSEDRLAIKSPIRDQELKRKAADIEWSIKLIDKGFQIVPLGVENLEPTAVGRLMTRDGYATSGAGLRGPQGWPGALPEVELKMATLKRKRAAAEAALTSVLITDEERTAADAESQELAAAFNAMTVRIGPDGRLVAYDEDGAVIERSSMTALQRKAIERMGQPREPVER